MKRLLLLLLAASMLTGCAKSSNINDRSDAHGEPHFYGSNARAYGDGLTYSAGGTSYCLDFGTMEKIPLCARPNCSHTSGDCLAKTAGFGLIYDSYVYYFTEHHGMKERKDGKPYFEMDSKLMRASLDSSETEVVSSFTDSIPRSEETLVIDDDVLYFIAYDPEPEIDVMGARISALLILIPVDIPITADSAAKRITMEENRQGRISQVSATERYLLIIVSCREKVKIFPGSVLSLMLIPRSILKVNCRLRYMLIMKFTSGLTTLMMNFTLSQMERIM